MTTQALAKVQVQTHQTWNKETDQAQVGDYFHLPFMPVMCVVERDELESGEVRLLVRPVTGSYSEEWIIKPVAVVEPQPPELLSETKPKPQAVKCPSCGGDGCGYCGYIGLVAYDRIDWSVWSSVKHQFDYRLHRSDSNTESYVEDVVDIASNQFLGQIERYRNPKETWENSVDTYHWRILELESSRFLNPYSAAVEMQRLRRKAIRQKAMVLAATAY